jgi:Radical SAM superfamily
MNPTPLKETPPFLSVVNVRLGFATNSSSAHSIIINGSIGKDSDIDMTTRRKGELQFGWSNTTYSDPIDKLGYVAAATYHSLQYSDLTEWQVAACMIKLFESTPIGNQIESVFSGDGDRFETPYIDHQSAWSLPDPRSPHFNLILKQTIDFFLDPRVSIEGGNDNDGDWGDDVAEGVDTAKRGDLVLSMSNNWLGHGALRFKRDGDAMVVMNERSGAKIRLTYAGGDYIKALTPELVDLKITDACPYKCSFCYQSSLPDGKEPERNHIESVIDALGVRGLGVFEVAIGGGEPTAYKGFNYLLERCRKNYIKPNFTTFAVDWLLDEVLLKAVKKNVGGIGVSVHKHSQLTKAQRIKEKCPDQHVMVQHVLGTLNSKDTFDLLYAAKGLKIPVLLLGYKSVGFGTTQAPYSITELVDKIKTNRGFLNGLTLAVDTAIVANHPDLMEAFAVSKLLVTSEEGKFSMYVDAVENTVAASSYETAPPTPYRVEGLGKWRDESSHLNLVNDLKAAFATY